MRPPITVSSVVVARGHVYSPVALIFLPSSSDKAVGTNVAMLATTRIEAITIVNIIRTDEFSFNRFKGVLNEDIIIAQVADKLIRVVARTSVAVSLMADFFTGLEIDFDSIALLMVQKYLGIFCKPKR